ncbi:hypothetical protein CCS92_34515, partial [Methylobacterium radiotolerans]
MAGRIGPVHYTPGLFLTAQPDKASDDHHPNGMIIDTDPDGTPKRLREGRTASLGAPSPRGHPPPNRPTPRPARPGP